MSSTHTTTKNEDRTTTTNTNHETIIPDNARAAGGRELPPLKPEHRHNGSILLFYQYVEDPVWTKAEHKAALKKVIEIGTKYNVTGRGRVAQEGVNCTLTGTPNDIRSFCHGLREWKDVFNETDFKITDGIPTDKLFKSLSIRKANELVAYGLAGGKFVKFYKH
jgi:predicted sulfurtransferase